MLLVGAIVIALVMALSSALPGLIASVNDNPVAISTIIALAVVQSLPASTRPDTVFTTVIITIATGTLLSGVVFLVVGQFKLGNLVRFIPYPVIGGFLAGTGLILFRGAFVASANVSLTLTNIPALLQFDVLKFWLPAFIFGLVMMVVLNRFSHFLIVPSVILIAIGLFYAGLTVGGMSIDQAIAAGWLIEPVSEGGIWQPIMPADLLAVNWPIVWGQAGNIMTLIIIATVAVLLNTTALESAFQHDIDMNHEIKFAGIANIIAALGGSVVGYHYVGMSVLMNKMKAASRLVGIPIAVVCVVALPFGASVVSLIPKYTLGGLAFFIGLAFLYDWVYISFKKLARPDLLIILAIMFIMVIWGPLEGVVVGILITVALFIVNYSRTTIVRHGLSGSNYHSHIDRPSAHRRVLRDKGGQIRILTLQGFIFFGTSNTLLQEVRNIAENREDVVVRYLIIDLEKVVGLDSSALHNFVKIRQTGVEHDFTVVYAHFSDEVRRQFEQESFIDGSPLVSHIFPNLDYALEWCEDRVLAGENIEVSIEAHPLRDELGESFGDAALVDRFMTYLEKQDVAQGEYLIVQGEPADEMYFLISGRATMQVELENNETYRLQTVGPGSVIGIEGMLQQNTQPYAESIVIDETSSVYCLSKDALANLQEKDAPVAVKFQEFLLNYLAGQYSRTIELTKDLLGIEQ
jgi:SulP family sulfate permease